MRSALESLLHTASLTFLLALLAVAVFFGASQDALFFGSDLGSLLGFMASLAVIASLCAAVAGALLWLASGRPSSRRVRALLSLLIFSLLQAGFVNFLLQLFFTVSSPLLYWTLLLSFWGAFFWAAARSAKQEELLSAISRLAAVSAFLAVCVFASNGLSGIVRGPASRGPNVILIVLDGMSMSPFLDRRHPASVSARALAQEGRFFSQVRTNKVWTAGYFPTLYSGRKDGRAHERNLWTVLQGAGVQTMWISFHNDGLPDAHQFPYRGLRSTFLTQHTARLGRLFGLPHNLFLYTRPGYRGRNMGRREEALARLFFASSKPVSLLGELVPAEVERLRKGRSPFFLLVHADVSAGEAGQAGIWEAGSGDESSGERKELVDSDYAYGPERREFVSRLKDRYERSLDLGLKAARAFRRRYHDSGWDKDTLLILTADHGTMFSGGRIWYGFHPDEEVARVPLLLFGKGLSGEDGRLAETIDITQTLLSAFGIRERLAPGAISLLDERARKPLVTTLTRPSSVRPEFFLTVYAPGSRHRLNLAARAPGKTPFSFDSRAILSDYGIK
ncbi:MAG: hypothetical protein AAB339_07145 [Elusimicrobiota bacterium]